jgi:hypothetical protein
MKIVLFFSYLIFVTLFLGGAWIWARKKGRQTRKLRKPSDMQNFFFSDLPKGWYVSFQFCLGLALAALVFGGIFKAILG